jgi:hypothetical protein
VANALGHDGEVLDALPITPERVLRLLGKIE